MKIVIEYVFLENLFINLIILKTTALILREKGRMFFLSSFLGACLTVVMPLLYLSSVGWFFVEMGITIVLVCISFKFRRLKKFSQIYATYFIATFIYGGACYFFEGLFGIRSVLVILAIVIVLFLVLRILCKKLQRKKNIENFCYDVEIEAGGQKGQWKAFLDSGNMLTDPLTDKPVTLINFRVFSELYKDVGLGDILSHNEKLNSLKFAHYINFNTLGSDNKILVFQVDKVRLSGKTLQDVTVGLCLKNFNDAFGSDVILHNSVCENL